MGLTTTARPMALRKLARASPNKQTTTNEETRSAKPSASWCLPMEEQRRKPRPPRPTPHPRGPAGGES
eukprot:11167173-Lingulodinium_polyedra.AAC.1